MTKESLNHYSVEEVINLIHKQVENYSNYNKRLMKNKDMYIKSIKDRNNYAASQPNALSPYGSLI